MERPSLSTLEWIWLVVTVFFVAFVPALGLLLSVLGAMHAYYEDRKAMLVLYCALAGLGLGLEVLAL